MITEVPLEIDESAPRRAMLTQGCSRVRFINPERKSVEASLDAIIRAQEARFDVKHLEFDHHSRLTSVWPVLLFPNLESVAIFGGSIERIDDLSQLRHLRQLQVATYKSSRRDLAPLAALSLQNLSISVAKPNDIEALSVLRPLRSLAISSWPVEDLSPIARISARFLALRLGKLVTLRGLRLVGLHQAHLLRCTRLESARGARVPNLYVATCNALDLDTLRHVIGLRTLALVGVKAPGSLEFVGGCRLLEHLTITATSLMHLALTPLVNHPTLTEVWIPVTDRQIVELAVANKRIATSNGSIYFNCGVEISKEDYFLLSRERLDASQRSLAE